MHHLLVTLLFNFLFLFCGGSTFKAPITVKNDSSSMNSAFAAYFHSTSKKLQAIPLPQSIFSNPKYLPDYFDSRLAFPTCTTTISRISNQGVNCSSGWAVAIADVASNRLCIATRGALQVSLSAADLMQCTGRWPGQLGVGCHPGPVEAAWIYYTQHGLPTGGTFGSEVGCKPYPVSPDGTKIEGDFVCTQYCSNKKYPKGYFEDLYKPQYGVYIWNFPYESRIRWAISVGGPVLGTMDIFEDFFNYNGGVYAHTSGTLTGRHAVRILGWGWQDGLPYWLVANGFGAKWGGPKGDGTFKIRRGSNECGIESFISFSW